MAGGKQFKDVNQFNINAIYFYSIKMISSKTEIQFINKGMYCYGVVATEFILQGLSLLGVGQG